MSGLISRASISALAFCILTAETGQAQNESTTESPFQVITERVLLDLVVRDEDGRPVQDLKAEEVEVHENGVRQEITNFRFIAEEAGSNSGSTDFNPFDNVNLISLVFERLQDDSRHLARNAALQFVQEGMRKNTLVAVFAIHHRLYVLQQFTNDRELVRTAIEQATSGSHGEFISQSSAVVQGLIQAGDTRTVGDQEQTGFSLALGRPDPSAVSGAFEQVALAQVTLSALRQAQTIFRDQQGHASLASLMALVNEQRHLAGRKTLLLFSQGLQVPPGMVERLRLLISEANRANMSFYAVAAHGLTSERPLLQAQQMLLQSSDTSRSQFDTGLGRPISREEALVHEWAENSMRMNELGTLADLAESTGGFLIADTNDPSDQMVRVSEDIRTHYELAYYPHSIEYDGKFRSISIKVHRPKVKVQTRSGYFALPPSSDGTPILPYEIPLLAAINARPLPSDLSYYSRVLHFDRHTDLRHHIFVLEVPLGAIAFSADEEKEIYSTRLSLIALLKDQNGRVIRKFSQDYPLQGPLEKLHLVRNGSVIFMRDLQLPPGSYTFESAVVDHGVHRMSAQRKRLVVTRPPAGLEISSLSVIRRVDPVSEHQSKPDDPLHYQDGKIIPNLGGAIALTPEAKIGIHCIVYRADRQSENPQLILEVLQEGRPVARGTAELGSPDYQGKIVFVGTLPVDSLGPGSYEIRAVAQDSRSATKGHAFFTVVSPNQ
ncbi:MAG: VWA domain-containing protein [Acidobacteriota bacterium]